MINGDDVTVECNAGSPGSDGPHPTRSLALPAPGFRTAYWIAPYASVQKSLNTFGGSGESIRRSSIGDEASVQFD
jgi:hypothetical protein